MLQERQLSAAEEADILVFEGHLAAATRGVKINSQWGRGFKNSKYNITNKCELFQKLPLTL